jgi:hypothetical protein
VDPWHTVVLPPIKPGSAGIVPTVTERTWALLLPQALFAVTRTLPLVVPTGFEVMLVVVELPGQPEGSVHV